MDKTRSNTPQCAGLLSVYSDISRQRSWRSRVETPGQINAIREPNVPQGRLTSAQSHEGVEPPAQLNPAESDSSVLLRIEFIGGSKHFAHNRSHVIGRVRTKLGKSLQVISCKAGKLMSERAKGI